MIVVHQPIKLHPKVVEAIRAHGQLEDAKGGYEAVGFIVSFQGKAVGTVKLHNHAADPKITFSVEPWEQFRAQRKIDREGYEIFGVYHSHPRSEALPSVFDHKYAWTGKPFIIYSVIFDELKAYIEQDGVLEPVDIA